MNLFIPINSSLTKSALCLDDTRLNKQILEAYQIINIIESIKKTGTKKGIGYSYHSIIPMWFNNIPAIELFHDLCLAEWIRREKNNDFSKPSRKYLSKNTLKNIEMPKWFGRNDIHAAYRSKLLFKGSIDAVVKTLEIKFGKRYYSWKNDFDLPRKNKLTHKDRKLLYKQVKKYRLTLLPNHYEQFGWKEPDNLDYVWEGE